MPKSAGVYNRARIGMTINPINCPSTVAEPNFIIYARNFDISINLWHLFVNNNGLTNMA